MNIERIWALFRANCHNTKLWFDEHPIFIIVGAFIFLFYALFTMNKENSSAVQWITVVVCAFLILYAFGQMTGLGFGMSF